MTTINPQAALGLGQTGTQSKASLGEDFEGFLKILTVQLQQQDPLNPMDTDKFTSQLLQFTSVEQSIRTNDRLNDLIEVNKATQATAALGMLGKTVRIEGDSVSLSDGNASIDYALPEDAASLTATVLDGRGLAVRTLNGGVGAGEHRLAWDGRDQQGTRLPDGTYRVQLDARGGEGEAMIATPVVAGRVEGVESDEAGTFVTVDGRKLPLSAVRGILADSAT